MNPQLVYIITQQRSPNFTAQPGFAGRAGASVDA